MSARVVFEGLEELKRALAGMSDEMRQEAMGYVREATDGAAADLASAYDAAHQVTGRMRRGVRTEYPSSTVAIGVVKNTAKDAHLYEFGTQVRRTATGANRGAAPPHPTAIPIYRRRRQRMNQQLVDMVRRRGFEVNGDVG